jgi:hypothetical protein
LSIPDTQAAKGVTRPEKVPMTNSAEYLMIPIIDKKCQDALAFGWRALVCEARKMWFIRQMSTNDKKDDRHIGKDGPRGFSG